MMRQQEILNSIALTDENDNTLGHSRKAAIKGISQVVISRIAMAAPGMILLPILMERLESFPFMKRSMPRSQSRSGTATMRLPRVSSYPYKVSICDRTSDIAHHYFSAARASCNHGNGPSVLTGTSVCFKCCRSLC
ncbi:sideroflexin-1-3-like [Xenopus laevis]|uniref:Sideroflexin-1-3-like n=1 Tax=Xenopus laevis TaxID=8355 RepID=A0A8J1L7R2_XENLA|nr:sideroflexin-1-3-like [Xenopus laevis]